VRTLKEKEQKSLHDIASVSCNLAHFLKVSFFRYHGMDNGSSHLATATALPVVSKAAMPCSFDEPSASYGGKVTPVRHDFRPQEGSGQEERAEVSITTP